MIFRCAITWARFAPVPSAAAVAAGVLDYLSALTNFAIRPFGPTYQPLPVAVNAVRLDFSRSGDFQVAPSSHETSDPVVPTATQRSLTQATPIRNGTNANLVTPPTRSGRRRIIIDFSHAQAWHGYVTDVVKAVCETVAVIETRFDLR
jgi:hypothetical protein